MPLLRYAIDRTLGRFDLNDFADRSRALPECLGLLAPIKQSVLAQEYAGYIADRLQMDTQTVVQRLAATSAPRPATEREEAPAAPMPPQPAIQLSPRERERLRIEREFLSLCAREPQLGLSYAAVLAQTQWRRSAHADIAAALLAYLSENAQASAGDVVRGVEGLCPGSSSTLTHASTYDDFEPAEVAQFLAEELAIRDMEDSVVALNVQLKDPSSMSQEDYDMTYAAVVSMQKDLTALRREHKPLGAIN